MKKREVVSAEGYVFTTAFGGDIPIGKVRLEAFHRKTGHVPEYGQIGTREEFRELGLKKKYLNYYKR